ncbi:MAG TPA: efflux RND transporter periplasmic adaptor subunit [Aurantimonas sp.]|uniref:Efflux RND transporter periplasmic adaptor subunit n=1 Tax=Aurantimonas marianensis TaxID=2920428 RepID=A0A9X2KFL3_9HYPH|nr:efflux RND transporter periplasmic adaptor subunit [Aurantimonas marianensis]MCP3055914.1 efflux RND transporter periplasmic adaptor subunit [Aurantimonas marianensis]
MAFLKQLFVTLLVLLGASVAYLTFDPSAARWILESDIPLTPAVRSAVVWLAPEAASPETKKVAERPGRERAGAGRGSNATPVVAGEVTTGSTRTRMRAIGTGDAARSIVVYPDNTTGIVAEIGVGSGEKVEEDDVLVRLERASEEIAVERARIALDAAEDKVTRFERLRKSNTLSAVEVDTIIRERDNARLDLRTAEIALGKRDIRAPIAGRVGIVSVDKGDLVGSQTVIATVDERERLKVIFYTPESFVQELTIGTPVQAVSTARPGKTYEGHISAIDSRLDETSRTLRTEATIDNSDDALRPGMSFTVTLSLEGEKYLSLDPIAVVWERTGPIVWKIIDGKAQKAPIRIVERNVDRVLVISDAIEAGDLVVVEGLQSVRAGGAVEIQGSDGPELSGAPTLPGSAVPTPSAENAPRARGRRSFLASEAVRSAAAAALPTGTPPPASKAESSAR